MKTFLTSDWHLGETRFRVMQRPFQTPEAHVAHIIEKHNAIVAPEDFVYVIGDVLYQKADPAVYLPVISQLNGRKVLIRGNHDRPFTDEQFQPYFETIHSDGSGVELELSGIPCYLTHYPSTGRVDRFNLVGHIHSAWKFQLNSLNVGLDVHNFSPVNIEDLPFFFQAIKEFYDQDVWAAYLPVNETWWAERGQKTSYFKPL